MAKRIGQRERVFKTAWFAKAAKKSHIEDAELCSAIRQVMLGQAADLGGGVYKKRLAQNLYRSIIVARGGRYWLFSYLFAKSVRANIDRDELNGFRSLAALWAKKDDGDIEVELLSNKIVEICNGGKS